MTEEREFLNSELHKAIANGNSEAVEDLLRLLSSNEWSNIEFIRASDALHELKTLMSRGLFQEVHLREIRDLLDFHAFGRQHPEHCFSVTSFRDGRLTQSSMPIRQLMQHGIMDKSFDHMEQERGTTWIHVPSTNGLIIVAIFRAMQRRWDYHILTSLVSFFYEHFQSPAVAPGDPFLNCREALYWSKPGQEDSDTWVDCNRSVIVVPYLALNTFQRHKDSRKSYENTRQALSTNTLMNYSADCIFHTERTLDEVYYTGLSADDLVKRNADQVVSRKFRNTKMPDERIPILMVPQLWLWSVEGFMISAYSRTGDSAVYEPRNDRDGELRDRKGNPIASTLYRHLPWGLVIASHIESFGKESHVGGKRFLPALDIFENEVVAALSDVDKYIDETKPSSVDYKKERNFLHVLSDIRSELVMVLYVLEQQKKVLKDMIDDMFIDEDFYPDWVRVRRAESSLAQYEGRIKKIDGDTERIEKAVNDMLNLKRTYASIKDTHSSLLLSTAVIGFTVITIVFAPLAFLTALFALKIDGFEKLHVNGSDPDSAYKSNYMGGIFISSEIVTIALTVVTVVGSLWYIKRWDRLEEEDMKKGTTGKGKDKARSDKADPIRQTDVESQ